MIPDPGRELKSLDRALFLLAEGYLGGIGVFIPKHLPSHLPRVRKQVQQPGEACRGNGVDGH